MSGGRTSELSCASGDVEDLQCVAREDDVELGALVQAGVAHDNGWATEDLLFMQRAPVDARMLAPEAPPFRRKERQARDGAGIFHLARTEQAHAMQIARAIQ